MEIRILGPVELARLDGRTTDLQLQCRKVLALLAVSAGRALSTRQIVERVWPGDPPQRAAQMVRSHVRVLRGVFRGDSVLTRSSTGYRLDLPASQLDAMRFTSLLRAGRLRRRDGDSGTAARILTDALELWRGTEAMPDVRDVAELQAEAARLEELRLHAEELTVECLLRSGRADEALPLLRVLTRRHPQCERFWLYLMVAQAMMGRRLDATGVTFRQARSHLVETTGLDAHNLDALQRAILAGCTPDELLKLTA